MLISENRIAFIRAQEDILHGQRHVRVSSFDQNPERQLEHVEVGKVFTDKASGKDTLRPELNTLLAFVHERDTVTLVAAGLGTHQPDWQLHLPAEQACRTGQVSAAKDAR
jgi:hypothetical protein